jgi:hypothetical protein
MVDIKMNNAHTYMNESLQFDDHLACNPAPSEGFILPCKEKDRLSYTVLLLSQMITLAVLIHYHAFWSMLTPTPS